MDQKDILILPLLEDFNNTILIYSKGSTFKNYAYLYEPNLTQTTSIFQYHRARKGVPMKNPFFLQILVQCILDREITPNWRKGKIGN